MSNIAAFGKSDVGRRRTNNEDSCLLMAENGLVAVADGMGGAAAGEVASGLFVEVARELFSAGPPGDEQGLLRAVQAVFQGANERILAHAKGSPGHQGMGCTGELLAFSGEAYVVGHVGDSRSYLFRNGKLRQITRDHSLIQEQIDGLLSPEDAQKHGMRNLILRAVGVEEALAVDLIRGRAFPGDLFLLCSDGLWDMVPDSAVQELLATPGDLPGKCGSLVAMANEAGGHDNVTVVLCEVRPAG